MVFYFLRQFGPPNDTRTDITCDRFNMEDLNDPPEARLARLRKTYPGRKYRLIPKSCVMKTLGRLPPAVGGLAIPWPLPWPDGDDQ
jgi:hypothetical protein